MRRTIPAIMLLCASLTGQAATNDTSTTTNPEPVNKLKVSLTAAFANPDQVAAFFQHTPNWKPDRLVLAATDWNRASGKDPFWRGQEAHNEIWDTYPFGGKAMPKLASLGDPKMAEGQLAIADAAYQHCVEQGVQFVFTLVIPKFPLNRVEDVRKSLPQLFDDKGQFDLSAPAYLPLLESTLDEIRERYPRMAGFEIWISEGAGATIRSYSRADLEAVDRWLPGWLAFLDSYGKRHGVEMTIFAHQYVHSRATRAKLDSLLQRYPSLQVLEDLTWPEEHVALPYFGYMGIDAMRQLAADNPLHVNFLLDTEYMGQGRIPSVLPAWIQGGIHQSQAANAQWVNGRVNWWDDDATLDNWNLFNVDLFCALARNPDQNVSELLQTALARRFGEGAAPGLAELLMDSQRLIYLSQTINGILFTDHSGFPLPPFLNRVFSGGKPTMKTVDDLFAPPGTRLFQGIDGSLNAVHEWREQLCVFARSPENYLREKDEAIAGIEAQNHKVQSLLPKLSPGDADFVRTSYGLWLEDARALRLFVEAAAACSDWTRSGNAESGGAPTQEMKNVAESMDQFADRFAKANGESTLFDLAGRLRGMAKALRQPQKLTSHAQ